MSDCGMWEAWGVWGLWGVRTPYKIHKSRQCGWQVAMQRPEATWQCGGGVKISLGYQDMRISGRGDGGADFSAPRTRHIATLCHIFLFRNFPGLHLPVARRGFSLCWFFPCWVVEFCGSTFKPICFLFVLQLFRKRSRWHWDLTSPIGKCRSAKNLLLKNFGGKKKNLTTIYFHLDVKKLICSLNFFFWDRKMPDTSDVWCVWCVVCGAMWGCEVQRPHKRIKQI